MLAPLRAALQLTLHAGALALSLVAAPSHARAQQHEHRPGMQHPRDTTPPLAAATLPGQDAFAAIAEVVRILRADRSTDWSRVNLEALRQHLIDMNAVTLGAASQSVAVPGGVRLRVTGEGRVRDALRRMIPAHTHMLTQEGLRGEAREIDGGIEWTVTSTDAARAVELRALGFIGILALGDHHTTHHLQLARGEQPQGHAH